MSIFYPQVTHSFSGNTTGTSLSQFTGTYVLAGGNNITLSNSTNSIGQTISIVGGGGGLSAGLSNLGNTSGTTGLASQRLVFVGGNNITLSGSTNAGSMTLSISGITTVTEYIQNITAGTTNLKNGIVSFEDMNNVTWGLDGNTLTASVHDEYFFSAGVSNLGNTSGNTGVNVARLVLAGGNNITLSQATGAGGLMTVTVSAGAGGAGDGVNIIAAGTQTANTTGSVLFQNSNGISFGMSNSSVVTASYTVPTQSVESQSFGMSNLGNTSGTTGIASGGQVQFLFAGGNNITLSQSVNGASGTVTISAFTALTSQSTQFIALTLGGNTAGTTSFHATNNASLFLHGGNNITLSGNGNSVTISGGAGGGGGVTLSSTNVGNERGWGLASISLVQNSLYVMPALLPVAVAGSLFKMPVMVTNSSSAFAAHTRGYTAMFGIFSRNATNSTVLTQHYSTSYTASFSANSNGTWNIGIITGLGNSTSYNSLSVSSAGLNLSASVHGAREIFLPCVSTFTAGEYWIAFAQSSSSAGAAGNLFNVSNLVATSQTQNRLGVSNNASSSGIARNIGLGTYSATTGAIPTGISMTQINQAATNPLFYFVAASQ